MGFASKQQGTGAVEVSPGIGTGSLWRSPEYRGGGTRDAG